MTRRLRLALLLASLVVAGPMPPVRAVHAADLGVNISWLRSERVVSPGAEPSNAAIAGPETAPRRFGVPPAPYLPTALLSYSLFQRPPPLAN